MDTIEKLYQYFEAALLDHLKELGRGGQKMLAIDANISSAFLNQIINPKNPKKASLKTQKALAKACGYIKYENFLHYGKTLMQSKKTSNHENTLSIKESEDTLDLQLRVLIKDHELINALKQPYIREIIKILVKMDEPERREIQKLSQEKIELKKLRKIIKNNQIIVDS